MPVIALINGHHSDKIEINENYHAVSQVRSHIEKIIGRPVISMTTLTGNLVTDAKPLYQYSVGPGTHVVIFNVQC